MLNSHRNSRQHQWTHPPTPLPRGNYGARATWGDRSTSPYPRSKGESRGAGDMRRQVNISLPLFQGGITGRGRPVATGQHPHYLHSNGSH